MKKIIICSLIALSILSCKKTDNENKTEIATENKSESIVEEKISIDKISEDLRKSHLSEELSKFSDGVINKIAEHMIFKADLYGEGEKEHLKELGSFENNMLSLYWETCGTGGCANNQTLLIKDNEVIDLGNGFDKLSESEDLRLENLIKTKIKNYSHISGRNGADIKIKENGNYVISFGGLSTEDAEATGGSLEITYETEDLKTFITNSVKVVERM